MNVGPASLPIGRRIRNVGRLVQITNVFARHGLLSVAEALGMQKWMTPAQLRRAKNIAKEEGHEDMAGVAVTELSGLPARLRSSFEQLGPAWVKLGQVLASREDILPPDYVEELAKLHSHVQALPFEVIQTALREELGDRMSAFENIETEPLAAGSIGQVHRAVLKTGEAVVVKVQRPGIVSQINHDLNLMEDLAGLLENVVPETRGARPRAMVAEFARATRGELDFIREGGNITKLARNFAEEKNIEFPEVHWRLTTPRVLTMTQMSGLPVHDRAQIVADGLSPERLVERGFEMFLKMVFQDGLYHGDLHPGNLLAMPDDRVGVIDMGLVVHLPRSFRENLAGLLIAIVKEDYERAVQHYIEISDPAIDFNAEAFEHDLGNAVSPFVGLQLEDMRVGNLFWELARVAAEHGAPMPQELAVFVKTLVSFEGIGSNLHPGFDILTTAEKFTAEIGRDLYSSEVIKSQLMLAGRDLAQLAKHAPFQTRRLLKAALEGELTLNIRSPEAENLATALDKSSSRIAVSVIIGALVIGSSIMTFAKVGPEMFLHLPLLGLVGFGMAGFLGFYVIWSVFRGGNFK